MPNWPCTSLNKIMCGHYLVIQTVPVMPHGSYFMQHFFFCQFSIQDLANQPLVLLRKGGTCLFNCVVKQREENAIAFSIGHYAISLLIWCAQNLWFQFCLPDGIHFCHSDFNLVFQTGYTFLPCVLAGLSRAPQYIVRESGSSDHGCILASDVDSIILPIDACGGEGSLAFARSSRKKVCWTNSVIHVLCLHGLSHWTPVKKKDGEVDSI